LDLDITLIKTSGRKRESPVAETHGTQVVTGAVIACLLVFGLIAPVTAMQFENHNSFCASCHTEGEQTFYDRSINAPPQDLASLHDIKGQARCIDCHTGPGIIGRYRGLMAGTTHVISFASRHFPQPATLEEPFPDANCLKCHAEISQKQDFNNHFHVFLPRWQAIDKNAAICVDCHLSHDNGGSEK